MSASRFPDLTTGTTFNFLTDLHLGDVAFSPAWMDRVLSDLYFLRDSHSAHIFGGDQVDNNRAGQYQEYDEFRVRMGRDGKPILEVAGNHDMGAPEGHVGDVKQSKEQWAALMGLQEANNVLDVGGLRFLTINPDYWHWMNDFSVSADSLEWLDEKLSEVPDRRCWLLSHGPPDGQYTDYRNYSIPRPVDRLDSLVRKHSNVTGWLSGHRHCPLGFPQMFRTMTIGGRTLFAINGPTAGGIPNDSSRPRGDAGRYDPRSTSDSLFITDLGDQCVIRWRDHRKLGWSMDEPLVLSR